MGRYALLVGISNYEADLNPLPSAVRDVEALERVLINPEIGGFTKTDVTVLVDCDRQVIERAIYKLFANRKSDDLLLFYFSGHGVTDSRNDFFLASKNTSKEELPPTAIAATYVHDQMNKSRSKRQVVILDCCHSGAFPKGMTAKGLDTVNILPKLGGEGRAILTASDSTKYAFEQEGFKLSLYTHFLVEGLEKGAADLDGDGDISVDELYEYVKEKVKNANDSMSPEFYPVKEGHKIILAKSPKDEPKLKYRKEVEKIVRRSNGKISVPARNLLRRKRDEFGVSPLDAPTIEEEILLPYREYAKKLQEFENTLRDTIISEAYPFSLTTQEDLQDYENHLGLREEDIQAVKVLIIVPEEGKRREVLPKLQDEEPKLLSVDCGNGVTLDLVRIPAGSFEMGMPAAERKIALENAVKYGNKKEDVEKWLDWSTPVHQVNLPEFFMGKFAVTQKQWQAVMGNNPSSFKGENLPVEKVSWHDAREFCRKLSAHVTQKSKKVSETAIPSKIAAKP